MASEAINREEGSAFPDGALTQALRGFVQARLGRHHAESDDVVQETFVRLLGYQASSRVSDVKALCFTIARNLLLDHHRSEKRSAHVELDESIVCPLPK